MKRLLSFVLAAGALGWGCASPSASSEPAAAAPAPAAPAAPAARVLPEIRYYAIADT